MGLRWPLIAVDLALLVVMLFLVGRADRSSMLVVIPLLWAFRVTADVVLKYRARPRQVSVLWPRRRHCVVLACGVEEASTAVATQRAMLHDEWISLCTEVIRQGHRDGDHFFDAIGPGIVLVLHGGDTDIPTLVEAAFGTAQAIAGGLRERGHLMAAFDGRFSLVAGPAVLMLRGDPPRIVALGDVMMRAQVLLGQGPLAYSLNLDATTAAILRAKANVEGYGADRHYVDLGSEKKKDNQPERQALSVRGVS